MTRLVYTLAALLVSLPAFAEEGEKAAGGTSVPQFDPSTYVGQVFWLVISFTLLYIMMAKIALPRAGHIIETRSARLAQDLEQARSARDDAQRMQAGYEAGLATARSVARENMATATAAAQAAQTAALTAQNQAIVARVQEAEAKIKAAKTQAMTSIEPAAKELAGAVVKKLTGM
jgi:F-type H+-transporting ATPase subunit b